MVKSIDELYEGGSGISTNSCEQEEMCCLKIPIKLGVRILCFGTIAGTILEYILSFRLFYRRDDDGPYVVSGILYLVAALPLLLASYMCIKWLMDDN